MSRLATIALVVTFGCSAESVAGLTAQQCAAETTCAAFGTCGLVDGVCAPTSELHCRNAQNACQTEGRCALGGATCVAATDADCRAGVNCKALGHCSLLEDVCAAVTVDDCQQSQRCLLFKQCEPKLGECTTEDHGH